MTTEEIAIERHFRRRLPNRRDLVAILFRQRYVILGSFAFIILATVATGMWRAKYEAHMKILVSRQRSNSIVSSSATEPVQFSNEAVTEEDLNTEVELLNSEDLLRKVVVSTGLSGAPGPPNDVRSNIRIAKAEGQVYKNLNIEALRKSDIITVRYVSRDPEKAAQVLQAMAAAYIQKHTQEHHSTDELKFFDQETNYYRVGLDKSQKQLTDFAEQSGVVAADIERDGALRQANEFDTAANQAKAAVSETERRIATLRAQLKTLPKRIITVQRKADNPQLLQQLGSTLLTLQLKRTELLTKYEPSFRLVQEVDQQIAETNHAIERAQREKVVDESSDQDTNYLAIQGELNKSEADLEGLKARASTSAALAQHFHATAEKIDRAGMQQQDLKRDVKTQEENYLLYERKREEARINEALDRRGILNVAVTEEPTVPVLRNRSRLNLAVLTLLIAGTFSLTAAFVVDFMDPTFRTPDELAYFLGAPVLGALPRGEG